jgi:hypothetical protein
MRNLIQRSEKLIANANIEPRDEITPNANGISDTCRTPTGLLISQKNLWIVVESDSIEEEANVTRRSTTG